MPKALFASLLVSTIIFTACSGASSGNKAQNAGYAMAETACLLFDEDVSFTDIESMTEEIMQKYGFESPEEIDTYLAEVRGTEEINEVSEAARTQLEATCPDALEATGVTAADLAEAMVSE